MRLFTGLYIGSQEDLENFECDLNKCYSKLVNKECRMLLQTGGEKWKPENRHLFLKEKLAKFEYDIEPTEKELHLIESILKDFHTPFIKKNKSCFKYFAETTTAKLCTMKIAQIRKIFNLLISSYEHMNENKRNILKDGVMDELVEILEMSDQHNDLI